MLKLKKINTGEWRLHTDSQSFLDEDQREELLIDFIIVMSGFDDMLEFYLTSISINDDDSIDIKFFGGHAIEDFDNLQDKIDDTDIIQVWSIASLILCDILEGKERELPVNLCDTVTKAHKEFEHKSRTENNVKFETICEFYNLNSACNFTLGIQNSCISSKFSKYKGKFYVIVKFRKESNTSVAYHCIENCGKVIDSDRLSFFKEHVFN